MNKVFHLITTVAFTFTCLGLYALLGMIDLFARKAGALPAFTQFCMDGRFVLLLLPVFAAVYCTFIFLRKTTVSHSGPLFF